jgi:hypothetical protein
MDEGHFGQITRRLGLCPHRRQASRYAVTRDTPAARLRDSLSPDTHTIYPDLFVVVNYLINKVVIFVAKYLNFVLSPIYRLQKWQDGMLLC